MDRGLTGITTLSYLGVQPTTPPQMIQVNRDPTVNDSANYTLYTLWATVPTRTQPATAIWMLVGLINNKATWIKLWPEITPGAIVFIEDTGQATIIGGQVQVRGGVNISTVGFGNTIQVQTVNNPTFGMIAISSFSAGAIVSDNSGNLSSINNTSGYVLTAQGPGSVPIFAPASGGGLTSVATNSGTATPSGGVLNIFGGINTLTRGTGATVSIDVVNSPTFSGTATANVLASTTSITAGTTINAGTIITAGTGLVVSAFGAGVVQTNSAGAFFSDSGTDGQVIISSSTGVPAWMNITGSGGITITNGANSINIAGSTNIQSLTADDTNVVTPTGGGTINVNGDGVNITTTGATAHQLEIHLASSVHISNLRVDALGAGVVFSSSTGVFSSSNGTNGQVIIGGGTAPAWANITSGDGSITFTTGANTLDIRAPGGGGGSVNQLAGNTGVANPNAGVINVHGDTTTITITGDNVHTLTAGLVTNPTVTGLLTVNNGLTVTGQPTFNALGLGVVQSSATGVLSSSTGTDGQVLIASSTGGVAPAWAHLTPGANITITNAGNSITIAAASGATGASIFHTDAGDANQVGGALTIHGGLNINTSGAGSTVTINTNEDITITGDFTTTVGDVQATMGLISGQDGLFTQGFELNYLGAGVMQTNAGGVVTSNNGANGTILIGGGTAPAWMTITAGTGISVTNGANSITINNTSTSTGASIFNGNVGTANTVGGTIDIFGGENTNTVAGNPNPGMPGIVNVNLNHSIFWPSTAVNPSTPGGYDGIIFLNNDLFMHARGTNNTFLGTLAGNLTLTTGSATNNTGIGEGALTDVTTGARNSALGAGTLNVTTTGSDNAVLGYEAGSSITTGSSNVLLGSLAGSSITTGSDAVAVGYSALSTITTVASRSTAVGYLSLQNQNNSGIRNTAVGYNTGQAVTTATDVTLVGFNAGAAITTSAVDGATAVGSSSLQGVTTGARNSALGYQSAYNLTTGTDSTAIGYQTMYYTTTSSFNTAIGSGALNSMPTGYNSNTAVGYSAGLTIEGANNTAVGADCINTCGADNTGVGALALRYLNSFSTNNTAVGYNAGPAVGSGCSNAIFIGSGAGINATNPNNSIFIGNPGASDADEDVIRIGTEGTQTLAYCAGIYGVASETNPNSVVFVNADGQLNNPAGGTTNGATLIGGTNGPVWSTLTAGAGITITNSNHSITIGGVSGGATNAFLYIQETGAANAYPYNSSVGGIESSYILGTITALSKIFDRGISNQFVGTTFTCPKAGIWLLSMQISLSDIAILLWNSTSVTAPFINVVDSGTPANTRLYGQSNYAAPGWNAFITGYDQNSYEFTQMVQMGVGATAQFGMYLIVSSSGFGCSVGPDSRNVYSTNATFVSGYWLST